VNSEHCKYSVTTPQEQKLDSARKTAIEKFNGHDVTQVDGNTDAENHSNLKQSLTLAIPRLGMKFLNDISASG
jgi:hypothetical protein